MLLRRSPFLMQTATDRCMVTSIAGADLALAKIVHGSIAAAITDTARISVQSAVEKYDFVGDHMHGNASVAWGALCALDSGGTESLRSKFMSTRTIDGSNQRAHIARMDDLRPPSLH